MVITKKCLCVTLSAQGIEIVSLTGDRDRTLIWYMTPLSERTIKGPEEGTKTRNNSSMAVFIIFFFSILSTLFGSGYLDFFLEKKSSMAGLPFHKDFYISAGENIFVLKYLCWRGVWRRANKPKHWIADFYSPSDNWGTLRNIQESS